MNTVLSRCLAVAALVLAGSLSTGAQAHRAWMLPSATVLSGDEPWITVDAAISNDLFYFEHHPMRLDNLVVFAPDGHRLTPENPSTGKYRSTFDVKLAQPGTYKLASVGDTLFARYRLGTETKRVRGTAESLAKQIPAQARDVEVTRSHSRVEAFVTAGAPSDTVLRPTRAGLELVPITHPNDLFAGEQASFRFLLDGKPLAGLDVTVVPGGIRYRDTLDEIRLKTDQDGRFSITWPAPGRYWIGASHGGRGRPPAGAGAAASAAVSMPLAGTEGTLERPVRRFSYAATLEVLAP